MFNGTPDSAAFPEVILVLDRHDPLASQASVVWAAEQLSEALKERQIPAGYAEEYIPGSGAAVQIVIAGPESPLVRSAFEQAKVNLPEEAEAFAVAASPGLIAASGFDARGLVYAVLELTDRVRLAENAAAALRDTVSFAEKPANRIRSVTRLFACEPEDKPWFYDRSFWDGYLTELAAQRFNRFCLALGMGYDYGHDPDVRDNYFCFSYPFLFRVPGYGVQVAELSEEERRRNYDMLQYIGEACRRRGLHFQLGLWNHSYEFTDSPNMNYSIEGITPQNHAEYCRDAIRVLLKEFPSIDGLTFRVHYEGGIPEPAYDFWRVVMEGTKDAGRRVEIDMHAKGINEELLKVALGTGQPVQLSPKYWAEHMGPAYHQAAIRENEFSPPDHSTMDMQAITALSRRFTRYGYADYMQDDRAFGVMFRLWPGTQKLLLWGDPEIASGYGRYASFCGALGIELCEPLTFKGRKGSGSPGGREPYLDQALQLPNRDWMKYRYYYRLWGRLLYNPDADPASWRRYLRQEYGGAAASCEQALAHASRILPLVTAAHLPSAANVVYWPEMYTNQPIVNTGASTYYDFDTPKPGTFGASSPIDTALFYRVDEFADDIVRGFRRGKYTPLETAGRLERLADTAEIHLSQAARETQHRDAPAFRRFETDTAMLIDIGRFFAAKFRASLAYALFERSRDSARLEEALRLYKSAADSWRHLVSISKDVYKPDITFGYTPHVRGHWADRLQAIERDIEAMELKLREAKAAAEPADEGKLAAAAPFLQDSRKKERMACRHEAPDHFRKGSALDVAVEVPDAPAGLRINLHYRHANQGERYRLAEMSRTGDSFSARIPADYTDSPFSLLYYFEAKDDEGDAWLYPGLNEQLSNQPYYMISAAGE
ncbi:hypothetical protein [Paenibacillus humicola]|uniref:hypothetical protein n=1 Tax=Paenibacillus humicola TaxID=3110540 RepID=UPI00237A9E9C|nr:hypothetical protein [Paenibacillus humicola]